MSIVIHQTVVAVEGQVLAHHHRQGSYSLARGLKKKHTEKNVVRNENFHSYYLTRFYWVSQSFSFYFIGNWNWNWGLGFAG